LIRRSKAVSNPIASYLGVHADALPLREQRMQLIASNLSNVDTPGYKAKDLDFNAALKAAGAAREAASGDGMATPRSPARPTSPASTATPSTPTPNAPPTAAPRWNTALR
jgi:flagellar basal-body rod protein FlgB